MFDLTEEAEQYYAEYRDWRDTYKILEYIEPKNTVEENEAFCNELKEKYGNTYLWTEHGTCEDGRISNGGSVFKSNCGCWDNRGWWITEKPWSEDSEAEDMKHFTTVPVEYCGSCDCDPDGENDCKADDCTNEACEDGWVRYYFDEIYDEEKSMY